MSIKLQRWPSYKPDNFNKRRRWKKCEQPLTLFRFFWSIWLVIIPKISITTMFE
ncbi:hypothetical protein PanWU01x14_194150, partial [Parasponia andersonii]